MIELKTVQNKIQGAIKDADRIASDNRTALGSASRNYITKCAGGLAAIAILVTVLTFSYSLFGIGQNKTRSGRPADNDRRDLRIEPKKNT